MNRRTISAWEEPVLASDRESVHYRIPADHPAFEGHFPGNPILPAVVQIHLCLAAALRLSGQARQLDEVRRAKFMRPVLPGDAVVVKMSPKPHDLFDFTLLSPGGEMHAQLQLLLTPR